MGRAFCYLYFEDGYYGEQPTTCEPLLLSHQRANGLPGGPEVLNLSYMGLEIKISIAIIPIVTK